MKQFFIKENVEVQLFMPVHIKLETERHLGGDTQIAQAQFFVNEIKVIMKAFALIKLEECHTIRMAPSENIALDDHEVTAGDYAIDLVSVFIR